jgi:hypothetical protein
MGQSASIKLSLGVQIMKQGKRFVAYTPALDLSTSGRTLKEAQKRFGEAVNLFFEEIIEQGTVDRVLKDLGWQKERHQWQPPQVVSQSDVSLKVPVFA